MDSQLKDWQHNTLEALRACDFQPSRVRNVTVLAYFWGTKEYALREFWRVEFAFLKTFETNGLIPAILVCNSATETMRLFCEKYSIEIQEEPSLLPGKIDSMSRDCLLRLHQRFNTEYVLIIQNDGFPMRDGLSEFVHAYDYVGAPFVRFISWTDWYPYRFCVGNGGFSLRSKRLCREVSRIYEKYFAWLPFWRFVFGDDNFYCRFLRLLWPCFNKRFNFASPKVAGRFSIEHNLDFLPQDELPLGFHGESGFRHYMDAMRRRDGSSCFA